MVLLNSYSPENRQTARPGANPSPSPDLPQLNYVIGGIADTGKPANVSHVWNNHENHAT
jgi:hypothetical protein